MLYRCSNKLKRYWDVSVVIPMLTDTNSLATALAGSHEYLRKNSVEVIIILSNIADWEQVETLIGNYPLVTWKVFADNIPATGSDRSRMINAGIRHAAFENIFIWDAVVPLSTDLIGEHRYLTSYIPESFATGPQHTLLAAKDVLKQIGGYDEAITDPLQAGEQLCTRLEMVGQKRLFPAAAPLYFWHAKVNNGNEGRGFDLLLFDSLINKNKVAREQFLASFETFQLLSDDVFDHKYEIICLIQVHNELRHLPEVLLHLESYCDGIILLDDGSTDGSYEAAQSEKLLLKARKRHNGTFDDLGNRNIMLRMADLFNSSWFLIMDADERFDPRYSDIRSLVRSTNQDVILFYYVHLWDNDSEYNIDIPDSSNGIFYRYRLYRNKGYMQIESKRGLHFAATPYLNNSEKNAAFKILVLHHGLKDVATRQRKFKLYNREDEGGKMMGHSYDFLLAENGKRGVVEELRF